MYYILCVCKCMHIYIYIYIAHWEEQRHNSKFDNMDLSILVKSPFKTSYFSKSVIAVSSKLTEGGRKSHNDTIQTCATLNLKLPLLHEKPTNFDL